ncbi:MAG TPA: nuclease [Thermoanaerobaculia bacterium]|nr:nuclease [Thermoanaerobaculia bacterium]
MIRTTFAIALIAVATNAFAWGEAGHLISNEAATLALPADMPQFFLRAFPQLVWLGPQPDRLKGVGPSLEAVNFPDHFLDYELAEGLVLPPDRYQFIQLMESSGRLEHEGITNAEAGFLPWRIAELSEQLTAEFRQWRFAAPGSPERRALEGAIIDTAGMLGHFVADAANPHHTTINYNGWILPNPNRYANDCQIHARFESDFVSRSVTTADVMPKIAAPVLRTDYFTTAIAFIRSSNSHVERLYQLDKAGAFHPIGPISAEGKTFATDRLAAGASMLRDYWWSAWKRSAERPPSRRVSAPPAN